MRAMRAMRYGDESNRLFEINSSTLPRRFTTTEKIRNFSSDHVMADTISWPGSALA